MQSNVNGKWSRGKETKRVEEERKTVGWAGWRWNMANRQKKNGKVINVVTV